MELISLIGGCTNFILFVSNHLMCLQVHYKFELMDETLYLTVNLIDRFLALQPVVRKKLQLVGVTAMLLACKYEEVTVPIVEDLILISDKAYSRKEVLDMVGFSLPVMGLSGGDELFLFLYNYNLGV